MSVETLKADIKRVSGNKKTDKPKPVKPMKKAEKKIAEIIRKEEAKKPKKIIYEDVPDVEYIIHETTKFDINWLHFKRLYVRFATWIGAPYTKEFWRKRGFKEKTPKLKEDEKTVTQITDNSDIEALFEDRIMQKPLTETEIIRIRSLIKSCEDD